MSNKRKQTASLLFSIIVLLIVIVGASYAFFTATASVTEQNIGVTAVTPKGLIYQGAGTLTLNNAIPGDRTAVTHFTVENPSTGDVAQVYNLSLHIDENGFTKNHVRNMSNPDDTSDNSNAVRQMLLFIGYGNCTVDENSDEPLSCDHVMEMDLTDGDSSRATGSDIALYEALVEPGETQDYYMYYVFNDTGQIQDENSNAEFGAHIELTDYELVRDTSEPYDGLTLDNKIKKTGPFNTYLKLANRDAEICLEGECDCEGEECEWAWREMTKALYNNISLERIESITILNSNVVPQDIPNDHQWSAAQDGSNDIMGWYIENENDFRCKVYFGQEGGVYANPDSSYLFDKLFFTELDISNLNTSLVNNMSYMFKSEHDGLVVDEPIQELDITTFNTSNVTNMSNMFNEFRDLDLLDLSGLDTSKVTDMSYMFYRCNAKEIDLDGINTANVVNMRFMFSECKKISTINLTSFNTSNVVDMKGMFFWTTFTSLDLSSFNTGKVTNMEMMFDNCTNVTTIYVSSNFITDCIIQSDYMFNACSVLVGGNGTAYNSANTKDKTYARVDVPGTPGYFTLKTV